jgi:tRNA nucleotidyltransferase (CCA-adding enzyme)
VDIYLVGGAVRDELLGVPVNDRDWLVVGGNEKHFIEKGFKKVGQDFPVFLHPSNGEEYALARKERKISEGYSGFECVFDESVTIGEDLYRRDLTINAIAKDKNGMIIDPYGGQDDIKERKLRHVSDHFIEDPLRVLRVARFLARYKHLGFEIADSTMDLMKTIASSGELNSLSSERVLLEMKKAFEEKSPSQFFYTLRECGALKELMPEIDCLFGVPQVAKYHPEIDTGIHTMMVLDQAKSLSNSNFDVMFAALVHDLGKGVTPDDILPRHIGHELAGKPLVEDFCNRLKTSSYTKKLSMLVAELHLRVHGSNTIQAKSLTRLLMEMNIFKDDKMYKDIVVACKADARGRTGFEDVNYEQLEYIFHIVDYLKKNKKNINKKAVDTVNKLILDNKIAANEKGLFIAKEIHGLMIGATREAIALLPSNIEKLYNKNISGLIRFNELTIEEKISVFNNLKIQDGMMLFDKIIDMHGNHDNFDHIKDVAKKYASIRGDEFLKKGLRGKEISEAILSKKKKVLR